MRIDKWLFVARFFKTRAKVVKAIEKKLIFLNGSVLKKQSQVLKSGDDILVKNSNENIRIIVKNFSEKRNGYEKAKVLYEIKNNTVNNFIQENSKQIKVFHNSFRPNKKDRRALSKLKNFSNYLK